jgi:glycosyltransferase involved in cell wall biosynthesis
LKKKVYLYLIEKLGLLKNIEWHVTDEQEKEELLPFLSNKSKVHMTGNIPSRVGKFDHERQPIPSIGMIALIGPMKNIHLVLKALQFIERPMNFHLWGPVKDEKYWQSCQRLMHELPKVVNFIYHHEIAPDQINEAFAQIDFYAQPSVSENFGHSIFDALNRGIPVITSKKTPWNELKERKAGWNVSTRNEEELLRAFNEALSLNNEQYNQWKKGALSIATEFWQQSELKSKYISMFSA